MKGVQIMSSLEPMTLDECVQALQEEIDRLKVELLQAEKDRNKAIELMTASLEDLKAEGKTLLDFHAVWMRSAQRDIHNMTVELNVVSKRSDQKTEEIIQLKTALANAEHRLKQIVHCDNCGGNWVNDGINSSHYCVYIKRLEDALKKIQTKDE